MSSSTSASNKRPSTSTQQRDSPAGRRKRDGHSYSPSPSTEANRRVVAARRHQYASMMEVVNTQNTSHVDHNAALAQHASSSAMVVDPTDAVAEALALNHRLLEREAAARRRLSESASSARISSYQHLSQSQSTLIANSQKLAKQHETRAKAIAVTNPGASAWPVGIVAPRSSPGYSFKEAEYDQQITQYMVEMDNETLANAESMDSQPEVQWYMRPFLVDFLIEVHAQFRLRPEVLYLAMNIVDRYVSKRVVYKKHYQLVGCAALWTAAKFEDAKDKVPMTKELSEMCCKAYDESAFIQMEGHVLGTIGWTLGAPTAEAWLRMYCMDDQEDKRTANVARFIMEISLFHRECVGVPAFDVAAGALMLARYICARPKRRDLCASRSPIFGPESAERALRVAYQIDGRLHHDAEPVSDVLRRKYTPAYYHSAATLVREWYSKPNNRFTNYVEPTLSGRPFNFPSPGPAMGASWRRGSWMSSSPTATHSASSSENGDEGPLTPVTPSHPNQGNVDPFSQHSKENVAPTPTRVKSGPIPSSIRPISVSAAAVKPVAPTKVADVNMLYPQRPALHALPPAGDMAVSHRVHHQVSRRLSN